MGLLERFCGHGLRRHYPSLLVLSTYFMVVYKGLNSAELRFHQVFGLYFMLMQTTNKSGLQIGAGVTLWQGFEFISQISSCWKIDPFLSAVWWMHHILYISIQKKNILVLICSQSHAYLLTQASSGLYCLDVFSTSLHLGSARPWGEFTSQYVRQAW